MLVPGDNTAGHSPGQGIRRRRGEAAPRPYSERNLCALCASAVNKYKEVKATMDFLDRVKGAMGGLEKFVAAVPGYKGYKEKELRREADKLLRDHLVRQFEAQQRRLNDQKLQLLSAGLMELMDDLDRASTRLESFIIKIRTAGQGYAGFFDAIKVKEAELEALYRFDNALLEGVPRLEASISHLANAITAREGVPQAIADLVALTGELNDTWARRQDAMNDAV